MALQIMKINLVGDVSVDVTPDLQQFFYVTAADIAPEGTLTIDATDFFGNDGEAVTEFPELIEGNSYVEVYINGVLQMADLYSYTPVDEVEEDPGELTITLPEGEDEGILAGTSIIVRVMNYSSTGTVDFET
ncbi:DUF4183 domain-containing protein [Alkalihalobacillus sp. 1P02AB]|uniref:DUF4183 domain-containing protein n=1 Tax=Alkalihalobacillus sp. 1P02AB TaxID=3132260 RepID=UPI0039A5BDFD